jgi:hypothetical protein
MAYYSEDRSAEAVQYSEKSIAADPDVLAYKGNLTDNLLELSDDERAQLIFEDILARAEAGKWDKAEGTPVRPVEKCYFFFLKNNMKDKAERAIKLLDSFGEGLAQAAILRGRLM